MAKNKTSVAPLPTDDVEDMSLPDEVGVSEGVVNSSAVELDEANRTIEAIKEKEHGMVISPEKYEAERNKSLGAAQQAQNEDSFAFKAGKDSRGRRRFNVKGFNNPAHIYRAAVMSKGNKKYYFFASDYDKLFVHNAESILTVGAFIKTKDGWQKTVVAKNQIVGPVTLPVEEATKLYEEVLAAGLVPD